MKEITLEQGETIIQITTLTQIDKPRKTNSSYGNWVVRYNYSHPVVNNCQAFKFFWRLQQATTWYNNNTIGQPVFE